MDSFEFNKITGFVLAALLVIVGSKEVIGILSGANSAGHGEQHANVGYTLPKPEVAAPSASGAAPSASGSAPSASGAAAAPTGFDVKTIVALVAKVNTDKGKNGFKKCKACHTVAKGGPNRVGPNLWNIVARGKASSAGFKYSAAMKGKGGAWSYGDLAAFLNKPKKFMPGTKMSFAGVKKNEDLADLVAYLRSLSDSPQPLPK